MTTETTTNSPTSTPRTLTLTVPTLGQALGWMMMQAVRPLPVGAAVLGLVILWMMSGGSSHRTYGGGAAHRAPAHHARSAK